MNAPSDLQESEQRQNKLEESVVPNVSVTEGEESSNIASECSKNMHEFESFILGMIIHDYTQIAAKTADISNESETPHISTWYEPQLKILSKQISKEILNEMNLNRSVENKRFFKNLFKSPNKLKMTSKKVKKKSSKFLNSGEIKKSDLFKEASILMNEL